MKTPIVKLLSLAVLLAVGTASLTVHADNAQQDKMKTCNADAKTKGLKGDERKQFMKSCLSAAAGAAATGNSQQEKMKSCNADAKTKGLKGDERKQFMKSCLKGG